MYSFDPFKSLAIAAKIRMKAMFGTDLGGNRLATDATSPGGIAMESLLNIKTIASLNLERERYHQFQSSIEREEGKPYLSSLKAGSSSGFGILVQQWVNAVALVWGGFLLIKYPHAYSFQNFLISMFALILSLFGVGSSSIGAVDKMEAEAATHRIFDIVDRQSPIDPLSDAGYKGRNKST